MGAADLRLEAVGEAGHASMPTLGDNAVPLLGELLRGVGRGMPTSRPSELVENVEPSAALTRGVIAGLPIAFLPRHGKGHVLSPSDINYRANIDVLKRAGVTDLVSLSACG